MKRSACLLAAVAIGALECTAVTARADDQSALILQRIEKLEKENAALKKEVNRVDRSGVAPRSGAAQVASRSDPQAGLQDQYSGALPSKNGPLKAPVQYVRVCNIYGEGFSYIPGTSACIKIGGYARLQTAINASGDGIVQGADTMIGQGLHTRSNTNDANYDARAVASIDVRAQTDLGILRGYARFGAEVDTPFAGSNAPTVFWDRGYIQFVGFTVGKQRSFFDIYSPTDGYLTYGNPRTSGDTNLTGVILVAYTYRPGGGLSATFSVENPNDHFNAGVANMGLAGQWGLGTLASDNGFSNNAGGTGFQMPDIVGNLRIDQSWGYAGISGVLHQVAGGYYTAANTGNPGAGCVAGTNCAGFGHPGTAYGWAIAGGGDLKLPTGPGDTIGVNVVYSKGAINYAAQGSKWQLYHGNVTSAAFAWGSDGVYDNQTAIANLTGTPIELTRAFSVNAGVEHFWSDQWRTSVYGGYAAIMYDSTAKQIINSHLPGGGGVSVCPGAPVFGAVQPPLGIPGPGSNNTCNPNYSFWDVGTRTQWNPVPWLDLGVDVSYTRLNTAYAGTGVALAANGANSACVACTISNQNVVSVLGRAQFSFDVGN